MDAPSLNLDDVDAWSPSGIILNPGEHICHVVDQEFEEKNGHPVVKLQMEAVAGEEQGGEIRDWIHITPNTLGRVKQVLLGFGVEVPSGSFRFPDLKGKKSKIIVRREPKNDGSGDTRTVVKAYQPLGSEDELASKFGATKVSGGGDPGPEPDIPF